MKPLTDTSFDVSWGTESVRPPERLTVELAARVLGSLLDSWRGSPDNPGIRVPPASAGIESVRGQSLPSEPPKQRLGPTAFRRG